MPPRAHLVVPLIFIVGQRCYRIEWESRRMTAIFGLLVASAFLTVALRAMDVPYVVRLVAKLGALAAFTWLGIRLRIVTVENIVLVRDLLMRRARRTEPVRERS